MQLADALKDAEVENLGLKVELRDLRYAVGKYEDAIETALERYEEGASSDVVQRPLDLALMKP